MKFEKLCVQKIAAFLIFDGRHKEYNTYVHYSITVHSPVLVLAQSGNLDSLCGTSTLTLIVSLWQKFEIFSCNL